MDPTDGRRRSTILQEGRWQAKPADLCTKNLTQGAIDQAIEKMEMEIRMGRADLGLQANRVECMQATPVRKKVKWADLQEEEEKTRRETN